MDEETVAMEVGADEVVDVFSALSEECHHIAREHGFWDEERNPGECIALMHSELSEALEALRDGNPPSKKADGYTQVEEELADVVIRIFDFAGGFGYDVGGALIAKLAHNAGRPYKHGREF